MRAKLRLLAGIAFLAPVIIATPVSAQSSDGEVQALRDEVQALKQQLATLAAKVEATDAAQKAAAKTSVPETKWKGAPETSEASGFTFKPRGRVQVDVGSVNAPNTVVNPSLGTATEFRRIYLGSEGTIPGGFGYRVEADLANSSVDLTDVWLTYKTGKTTFTVGQHKAFWGLEEMTSDLFTTFQERAAFNSAFGFERRVGLSAAYAGKEVLVQGGIFTDNAADLNNDQNNSFSFDGRLVYSPKLGKSQLHLGGSAHYRELNGLANTARYRARPFVHTTDLRFVDTKAFTSTGEASFGLEAALINGPFHATLEGHQLTSYRPGLANPTFRGGYAEVGAFLTKGDSIGYKGGVYDRIKPAHPLNKGGMGAFQVSARYDYIDLSDAGIIGGKQSTVGLSLIWVPIEYVRFIANYGHLDLTDSPILAGISNDYSLDSVGLRAQIDF
jgi:phosphate-selective porin OprO and OprP